MSLTYKQCSELWEESKEKILGTVEAEVRKQLNAIGRNELLEQIVSKPEEKHLYIGDDFYFAIEPLQGYMCTRYWAIKKAIAPMGNMGWLEVSQDERDMVKVVLEGLLYLTNKP